MIIESLLDTDLYKFTMMQVVLHQFPGAMVEYRFKCRNPDIDFRPFAETIEREVRHLCQLRFQPDELDYLRQFSFFKEDFIDYLRIFQLDVNHLNFSVEDELTLSIRGPWLHTILFEVPILAIMSEVYFAAQSSELPYAQGRQALQQKIAVINERSELREVFKFSDFGTRRRFSKAWHKEVVATLAQAFPQQFTGTSNVLLAKQFGITPLGTMAHEYLQACQSLGPRLLHSQKFAFEKWAQEYRGELGIALSDVFGMKAFLADFDLYFCKLFDGARQDSGDPFEWGNQMLAHYKKMRIDPKTKRLVFSDALDVDLALALCEHFKDKTNPVFGIGTHLTNDLGYVPLQLVIKMIECNGQPVAKITDTPGKTMCRDESYLAYLKQVFEIA